MPARDLSNVVSLRAPFGGLQADPLLPDGNQNCSDCRNVTTRDGGIALRPGTLLQALTDRFAGTCRVLRSVGIGSNGYLYGFDQLSSSGRHMLIDRLGAVRAFNSASVEVPGVAMFGGTLFCANGAPADSRKYYDAAGTLTEARIGMNPPYTPPAVSLTAGSLTGSYSYRYTYYNSYTGTESGPSTATAASPAGQGVSVTLTASPDVQVTHCRLYRAKSGVDSTWYLLTQTTPGVYVDASGVTPSTLDSALNLTDDAPPSAHILCAHRQRMWYRDDDPYYGTRVWYSEYNLPERVKVGSDFAVGAPRSDWNVAMVSAFGSLWLLNTNSIWAISGYDPSTFVCEKVLSGVGCTARDSVVEHEGRLYFVGGERVYAFDGARAECISDPDDPRRSGIGPLSRYYDPDSMPYLTAAIDPLTRSLVLNGTARDGTVGLQLVYNLRTDSWTRWDIPTSAVGNHNFAFYTSENHQSPRLVCAAYLPANAGHGMVATLGGPAGGVATPIYTEWTGAGLSASWRTPPLTLGVPRRKRFVNISAQWAGTAAGRSVTLKASADGGSDATLGSSVAGSGGRLLTRWGARGSAAAVLVELGGSSSGGGQITQIDIEAEVAGWR